MDKRKTTVQLALFVGISYAHLWLLYAIGKRTAMPFSYDPRQPGGILVFVGVPASLIGAIVATLVTRGRGGLRELFARSLRWRFSPVWYLAAVTIPLGVTVASITAAASPQQIQAPAWRFSPSLPIGLLVFSLAYNGLGEEIGWRGLALPQLQESLGSLGGSIAVGILWALWHVPVFFMPGSSQYGDPLLPYVYLLTCWTIVMALLVHKAQGSVWVAILVHETANFVAFALRYPSQYVHLFWGLAAIICIPFLPRPLFRSPWRNDRRG